VVAGNHNWLLGGAFEIVYAMRVLEEGLFEEEGNWRFELKEGRIFKVGYVDNRLDIYFWRHQLESLIIAITHVINNYKDHSGAYSSSSLSPCCSGWSSALTIGYTLMILMMFSYDSVT
jgi:hypothetical protein